MVNDRGKVDRLPCFDHGLQTQEAVSGGLQLPGKTMLGPAIFFKYSGVLTLQHDQHCAALEPC
jgi:hypothetical protein